MGKYRKEKKTYIPIKRLKSIKTSTKLESDDLFE